MSINVALQVKPSRISRIFVAAAVPDQLGGLPGERPAIIWVPRCLSCLLPPGKIVPYTSSATGC